MLVKVTKDNVIVDDIPTIHQGEYGIHSCEFQFSSEYNNLIKTAIFENGDYQIGVSIINDKCKIPNEVLDTRYNDFKLRVYGYEIIDNELTTRYSPMYKIIPIVEGSYLEDTTNGALFFDSNGVLDYDFMFSDKAHSFYKIKGE